MLIWFDAKRLFRINCWIFIKSTYGHMVWCTYCLIIFLATINLKSRIERYCPLKVLFFFFKISLANTNHRKWGLTRIVHLGKFNQSLSRADMVRFVLYLRKYSVNSSRYNTIWTILCSQGLSIKFHEKLFSFTLKYFLKISIKRQYGLTHIVLLGGFDPSL